MTQELACLLIGLGLLAGSGVSFVKALELKSNWQTMAMLFVVLCALGATLVFVACAGSSLPSIKEVGR